MSTLDDMIALARAAQANAYAPYSKFRVGACVRADSGKLYAGSNVENAAYPQGQCAEATAIGAAISAGERRIVEVVVIGSDATLCTPCGGCRQRLIEFADPEMPVHIGGPTKMLHTLTLGELMPSSFNRSTIGH